MMTGDDEATVLRRRVDDLANLLDRLDSSAVSGDTGLVCKTVTVTTYPTVAGRYYAVVISDPAGTESEGSTGSYADMTTVFYALNIGAAIPVVGTRVICRQVNGRWVFRY